VGTARFKKRADNDKAKRKGRRGRTEAPFFVLSELAGTKAGKRLARARAALLAVGTFRVWHRSRRDGKGNAAGTGWGRVGEFVREALVTGRPEMGHLSRCPAAQAGGFVDEVVRETAK